MYDNALLSGTMGQYTSTRYNHIVLPYWTAQNKSNAWYGPGVTQAYAGAINYEMASFLRVSDLTFGYSMPRLKLNRMGIDRLRFYLQVINPFIFTKYRGMDPEYNSSTYIDDVPSTTVTFGFSLGL